MEAAGSAMLCRMPRVLLPDDLNRQLEQSESGVINDTQGPGVAVYEADDGSQRADIYIGLLFDGLDLYRNISAVNSTIKMQYSLPPDLFCRPEDLVSFNPDVDSLLVIKVSLVSSLRPFYVARLDAN